MKNELETLYGEESVPALDGEVSEVLRQVGLISAGAVGGMLIKDQVLGRFLDKPLYCSLAEFGLGVAGATFAMKGRGGEMLLWPSIGVAVHGTAELLRDLLNRFGVLSAFGATGSQNGGNGGNGTGNGQGTLV